MGKPFSLATLAAKSKKSVEIAVAHVRVSPTTKLLALLFAVGVALLTLAGVLDAYSFNVPANGLRWLYMFGIVGSGMIIWNGLVEVVYTWLELRYFLRLVMLPSAHLLFKVWLNTFAWFVTFQQLFGAFEVTGQPPQPLSTAELWVRRLLLCLMLFCWVSVALTAACNVAVALLYSEGSRQKIVAAMQHAYVMYRLVRDKLRDEDERDGGDGGGGGGGKAAVAAAPPPPQQHAAAAGQTRRRHGGSGCSDDGGGGGGSDGGGGLSAFARRQRMRRRRTLRASQLPSFKEQQQPQQPPQQPQQQLDPPQSQQHRTSRPQELAAHQHHHHQRHHQQQRRSLDVEGSVRLRQVVSSRQDDAAPLLGPPPPPPASTVAVTAAAEAPDARACGRAGRETMSFAASVNSAAVTAQLATMHDGDGGGGVARAVVQLGLLPAPACNGAATPSAGPTNDKPQRQAACAGGGGGGGGGEPLGPGSRLGRLDRGPGVGFGARATGRLPEGDPDSDAGRYGNPDAAVGGESSDTPGRRQASASSGAAAAAAAAPAGLWSWCGGLRMRRAARRGGDVPAAAAAEASASGWGGGDGAVGGPRLRPSASSLMVGGSGSSAQGRSYGSLNQAMLCIQDTEMVHVRRTLLASLEIYDWLRERSQLPATTLGRSGGGGGGGGGGAAASHSAARQQLHAMRQSGVRQIISPRALLDEMLLVYGSLSDVDIPLLARHFVDAVWECAAPEGDSIRPEDFVHIFPREADRKIAWDALDGDKDGLLTRADVMTSVAAFLQHERSMALNVRAIRRLTLSLQTCLIAIINGIFLMAVYLSILDVAHFFNSSGSSSKTSLDIFAAYVLVVSLIFSEQIRHVLLGCVLILAQQPFDVGEELVIEESPGWRVMGIVQDFSLFYLRVKKSTDGELVTLPLNKLVSGRFTNLSRSDWKIEQNYFAVDTSAPPSVLAAITDAALAVIRATPGEYDVSYGFLAVYHGFERPNKVVIRTFHRYKFNLSAAHKRIALARHGVISAVRQTLDKLGVEFTELRLHGALPAGGMPYPPGGTAAASAAAAAASASAAAAAGFSPHVGAVTPAALDDASGGASPMTAAAGWFGGTGFGFGGVGGGSGWGGRA